MAHFVMLIVWYLSSVPNCVQISAIVTEIDAILYPTFIMMTSRQLTSGFDFWSRGHLRMAVIHLPIKFDADICPKLNDGGCRHLGFVGEPWDHPRKLIRGAYLL